MSAQQEQEHELIQLREEKKSLSAALASFSAALAEKQAEVDQVRRSRTAAVEARERRVQDQIDTAMVHNEELEKEYDKLNTHAKQLTSTVQTVVAERKKIEAQIAALMAEGYSL